MIQRVVFLQSGRPETPPVALNALQAAPPIELDNDPFGRNVSHFYHVLYAERQQMAAGQGIADT